MNPGEIVLTFTHDAEGMSANIVRSDVATFNVVMVDLDSGNTVCTRCGFATIEAAGIYARGILALPCEVCGEPATRTVGGGAAASFETCDACGADSVEP